MASVVGCGSASAPWAQFTDSSSTSILRSRNNKKNCDRKGFRVSCVLSPAVSDPYKTLSIRPGASESEVRSAFRQLAKKYHPDVCRGSNCGVQFHQINEAYDLVMRNLRGEVSGVEMYDEESGDDEAMRGMNDQDWELWEEWMGWEGAGIRDYSSHINPYI